MILIFLLLAIFFPSLTFSQENLPLLPERPFDRFIIYETLFVIWFFIGALWIILYMKLKEAERVQKLKLEEEEKEVPFLD